MGLPSPVPLSFLLFPSSSALPGEAGSMQEPGEWGRCISLRGKSWLPPDRTEMSVCVLKQMFQDPRREMLMAPFESSGIYFPSGPDFLRSVVQSRLDMKEALVG